MDIPIDVVIHPLLIELRSAPAYYCLIGETKVQDDLPWYRDIYQFLRSGTYPEVASVVFRSSLCRSSDERGSFRSLWSAYGRTHASP